MKIDHQQAVFDLAGECQFDPDKWSLAAWDWGVGTFEGKQGPRDWQRKVNQAIKKHLSDPSTRYQPLMLAVASGHGIGKSAEMGMVSNWAMSCWPDAKIVCTANTETQLRTKTSPEVGKWFKSSITAPWFDVQTLSIKSKDTKHVESWRMDFIPWSEHNTEAFAGLHNEGKIIVVLFDEGSKIADSVFETTEGALTDENTVIIWICFGNPTRNTGRFRECFRRYKHRWVTMQIDSRDVDGTNKEQFKKWAEDYGEDSDFFKVRVRGMFPSLSAKQFISEADVDAAFGKHLREEQYNFAPVILSCDPAWSGDDELVISMRQGLMYKVLRTMPKNDNDIQVANIIARYEDDLHADAVFVDAGYGTGIVSAGRTMGRGWTLVWFGGQATDKGCLNKRSEMWRDMRDWLKAGGAIPNDNILRDDLIGPETLPRLDGKIALESKEAMKDRGLQSPNRADALALTFAFPVVKKQIARVQVQVRRSDYDPFAV